MTLAGKTYCPSYDERCNGCLNEARWVELYSLEANERIRLQKSMHLVDEGLCQSNGMSEKDCKK